VPAPGESHSGAYLDEARKKNPGLAVVIMLSDPHENIDDAPPGAVQLIKPFDRAQLDAAIIKATRPA
jgi:hypothetical protein